MSDDSGREDGDIDVALRSHIGDLRKIAFHAAGFQSRSNILHGSQKKSGT